jgi:hypothetical protein
MIVERRSFTADWLLGFHAGWEKKGVLTDLTFSILTLTQQSGQGAEQPLWLTMAQAGSEVIWRGATVLAIFVGGFFTWYKFLRGRELVQRAEPKLSAGDIVRRDGIIALRADASTKNIGLARIDIDHAATCIELWLL